LAYFEWFKSECVESDPERFERT